MLLLCTSFAERKSILLEGQRYTLLTPLTFSVHFVKVYCDCGEICTPPMQTYWDEASVLRFPQDCTPLEKAREGATSVVCRLCVDWTEGVYIWTGTPYRSILWSRSYEIKGRRDRQRHLPLRAVLQVPGADSEAKVGSTAA